MVMGLRVPIRDPSYSPEVRLVSLDPTLLSGGWPLQLAVATALCDAEGEPRGCLGGL